MNLRDLPKPPEQPEGTLKDEKPTGAAVPDRDVDPCCRIPQADRPSRTIPRMPGQTLPYLPPPGGLEVIIMDDATGRVERARIRGSNDLLAGPKLHPQSRHLGAVEGC